MLKIRKYKGYEIHYVNGLYKYDIYGAGNWINSTNTIKKAKQIIERKI